MNELSSSVATSIDNSDLRKFVENSVVNLMGNSQRVTRIERKLNDYHSSFAIEELTVVFDEGTQLPVIFKNLSPDGLLEYARQIRPHFSYHPTREIAVYREILRSASLGTPTCYGTFVDPERQLYWLLLEKVSGHELAKTGAFKIWCEVARWLADMHRRTAAVANQYEHTANLLRYDAQWYALWIDRAERFCGLRASTMTPIAPSELKWLAGQCRRAIDYLCDLPVTIIHGEFYASNVLIDRSGGRTRVCPIDWETAAIGPGLLDLAALVAGKWKEEQKVELAMAYYDALRGVKDVYGGREEFMTGLRCARLFMAMKWLGWSSDWQAPDEHRSDWLAEAMQLAPTIESGQKSIH